MDTKLLCWRRDWEADLGYHDAITKLAIPACRGFHLANQFDLQCPNSELTHLVNSKHSFYFSPQPPISLLFRNATGSLGPAKPVSTSTFSGAAVGRRATGEHDQENHSRSVWHSQSVED